ncbi:MAG: PAS domain S-box protein [Deltaproteobacteria bacterium]|nr:PAS domain S-box protein [Deltaproteobacteria bacterium]
MEDGSKTREELIQELALLRQRSAAFEKAEEKHRLLIENSHDIIYTLDVEGIFTFVSPAWTALLGHPVDRVVGKSFREFVHPDDIDRCEWSLRRLIETGERQTDVEYRAKHADGSWRWHNTNAVPLRDETGTVVGVEGSASDITDRKQAEEALLGSEIRYQSIFENTGTVMLIVEKDMTISFANAEFEKLTGYRRNEIEGKKKWTEFVEKTDLERMIEQHHLRRTDKDFAKRRYEFRLVHREGRIKDIYLIADIIPGTEKSVVSLIDITERKQIEEALRDANWRMESIIEGTRVGTWEWNVQTGETVFNETWARIIGYTLNELAPIGIKTWETFAHPDDLKRSGELLERHFAGELPDYDLECRMKHKDGHWVWVHDRGRLITRTGDGKPLMMFGIHFDITERKRAEKTLQRQNVYLELLNETALGLMQHTDLADLFQTIVARAMHLSGAQEGWICTYNPVTDDFEYRAAVGQREYRVGLRVEYGRGIIGEVLRTKRTLLIDDYHLWPKRAKIREYDARRATVAIPLLHEGRLAGVLGLSHHDPARRFDSEELAILERLTELASIALNNAWLYDQVKRELAERKGLEAERDLMQAKLLQSEKLEAIGTLAGGIAHDFNNLLMGIEGYASLMLLELDPAHPHYERLKRIEEQVQSGADLTRQLLGFARGGRYEVKPADMNEILEKSSAMFGRTRKEITIQRKLDKDLRTVEVDRSQMVQVLMNLYVNAWQAMPGGGEICLETENVILTDEEALSYSVAPGEYVKITVTDTGTGMDEKTKARIFDPFFTTKEMGRGTGLGLATVYGIIKGHKGTIDVMSEPGRGTTFSIYLPASEKAVVKEKREARPLTRGKETILLADDEKTVLEVSREMLEFLGYRVYAVGSGQEAVAVYLEKQREIDLVILDMIMPGISGGETFDRLRRIDPAVKVLLASGYSINGEAKTIMDRGCNGFIQKPFQMEGLSRKIREIAG